MYISKAAWIFMIYLSLWEFGHSSSGGLCQSKINRHKNVCYWVETTSAKFSKSQQGCIANGGYLATVDSAETSAFLKEFFADIGLNSGNLWIGYNESNQRWDDGTLFSWSNYKPGEPDMVSEYCTVMVVGNGCTWVDRYCSQMIQSLCQIQFTSSRQFDFVGVDQGRTVSVGDREVVVQSPLLTSCGVQCVHDAYCFVFRYTKADKTCTLYNSGNMVKTVTNNGEWYVY